MKFLMQSIKIRPTADALPHIEGKSIGVIGGSGRVVRSFLTLMHHKKNKTPITIYAKDKISKTKLQTFLIDLGATNIKITEDLQEAQNCEMVIFCAGAKTQDLPGQKTKEDLLEANKNLAQKLLSPTAKNKAIIVVTNPTTKLVPYIKELTGKPTYGMGVENDNIRFQRSVQSQDLFLTGAHNFSELAVGSKLEKHSCKKEFNALAYKKISHEQDNHLKSGDQEKVLKHIEKLPREYRWYASQRLHSKLNEATNACAEAIHNTFNMLAGKADKPVIIEATIQMAVNETGFTCGWPFDPKTLEPMPLYFSDKQAVALNRIKAQYSLKPQAVIFDLSSTLINSQELDREALNHVLGMYGKPVWSDVRKNRDASKSIKENFPNFFGSDADEAYQAYIHYLLANKSRMPLFDGVLETLKILKKNNIKTIIISNRDKSFVREMLKEHQLEQYVSVAVGAEDTPYTKPDREIIDVALKMAGIAPERDRILFVGDSLADMSCADRSGVIPVLMRMCQTDVTDDWIKKRRDNQKPFWVMNNHTNLQNLIVYGRSNVISAQAKRNCETLRKPG